MNDLIGLKSENNRIIKKQIKKNIDFSRQEFKNYQFIDCEFISCNFYKAVLFGNQMINCKFINCNFSRTDFCSQWLKGCTFENCNFSKADILDNTFHKTILECKLNNVTASNNKFYDSFFNSVSMSASNFTFSEFINCTLNRVYFSSSFKYNFFDNCEINQCKYDLEIFGLQYGITSLEKITFKKNNKKMTTQAFCKTLDFDKLMDLNNMNLMHIFNNENIIKSLENILNLFFRIIVNDIVIQSDDIKFFRKIVEKLYESKILKPYNLFSINEIIIKITSIVKEKPRYRMIRDDFVILVHYIYFQINNFYEEFNNGLAIINQNDDILQSALLKITYDFEPSIRLADILMNSANSQNRPLVIKTEVGSFIEWIDLFINNSNIYVQYLYSFFGLIGFGASFLIALKKFVNNNKNKKKAVNNINIISVGPIINATTNIIVINNEIINSNYVQNFRDITFTARK